MSAITAKASRKMKKYAVLTREPRCFLGSFDFSWEQRKLSELTSMHARIGWQNLRTSEFLDSGNYMLITGTDFNDGAINFSTCHYVERERYEQDRNIQIHNGSILITKDGTLGKVAYVQGLSMPATLNAGVFNVQIKDANNVDEKYLFQYLKAPFLMDYVDKKATGGTIKHLNQSILVDFPVILPQRSEQTLIGAFFQQLDNLITLHQRQPFLHSTPEISLTVQLIHPFYTSSWEQRKFEEIAVRSSVICSDDTLPRVEYEDIVSGTGRLNKDIYAKQSSKSGIAFHQGDVLYGKLRPYLQNWLLPTFDGLAVGDFWVLQPQNADGSFLYRLIQSRQFDEVANQSTGTKMPRADWKLVSKTVFSIPSNISEQAAIGTYFTALDSLITLHQRKCALLFSPFQALISMMFTTSTFSWEQRKFSELVQIERGGSPRPIDDFITDAPNGLNWIKIGDAPTQGNYITKTAEKIRPEGLSKTREVHPGDLILSNSMSFGKPYIMGIDGCIHDGWLLIRNTYGVFDLTFLCHLLGTPQMLSQYRSLAAGSTVNNLNKELVGNTVVTIPSITEQRVLGDYLEQLDNLITLHQRKGKAAVTGCSNDANNSKGVYCKARDFGYKCYKKVKSQQIRCLIAVFIFFV